MGSLLVVQDWVRNAVEVEIRQCLQIQNDILLLEIDLQKQVSRQVGRAHHRRLFGFPRGTEKIHSIPGCFCFRSLMVHTQDQRNLYLFHQKMTGILEQPVFF